MGFIAQNSVGMGSTDTTGRNAGVSTETGTMVYVSDTKEVSFYDGTEWQTVISFLNGVQATGGTKTTSGGNTIHTFTSSGDFVVSEAPTSGPNAPKALASVLIVGGGGGGGQYQGFEGGGGGGAGGMVEASSFPLTAQTYPIVIGSGGAHTSSGTNSSAFGVSAIGGGRGGVAPSPRNGAPGGSGGGGGGQNFANPSGGTGTQPSQPNPGSGTWSNYGNPGGNGGNTSGGAGGGGAGGSGGSGNGGAGGSGRSSSISGTSVTYARGAGGGYRSESGCNPNGGNIYSANTGNGGNVCSEAGSPGIVVVRYETPPE